MSEERIKKQLRRYSDLPALIELLTNKRITLLDPASWDDRNDTGFMREYKERKSLGSLLALCLSEAGETYHHWRVFSSGSSGVCIVFKRDELLKTIGAHEGVSTGKIKYRTIQEIEICNLKVKQLPFTKRIGYKGEEEFRIVYESKESEIEALAIPIELGIIDRVYLSPWMHPSLRNSTVALLRSIDGCSDLSIARSTLTSNERWSMVGFNAED